MAWGTYGRSVTRACSGNDFTLTPASRGLDSSLLAEYESEGTVQGAAGMAAVKGGRPGWASVSAQPYPSLGGEKVCHFSSEIPQSAELALATGFREGDTSSG